MLIEIPAVPIAQPRPKITTIGVRGRGFVPAKHAVHDFKSTVRRTWQDATTAGPLDGPLLVSITAIMPRPSSLRWKSKPMPRLPHDRRPDCDNLAKSVLDALSGLAWTDDARIHSLTVRKWVAAGDEQPRVILEVLESNE